MMKAAASCLILISWALTVQARDPGSSWKPPHSCNGHYQLCYRSYSDIRWIGTHNAPIVGPITNPFISQQKTVIEQLDAGIRFLQAPVRVWNDDPKYKHEPPKPKTPNDEYVERPWDLFEPTADAENQQFEKRGAALTKGLTEVLVGTLQSIFTRLITAGFTRIIHDGPVPEEPKEDPPPRHHPPSSKGLPNSLALCYPRCSDYHGDSLLAYLRAITLWIEAHPSEVVTLLFTNEQRRPVRQFREQFRASGLDRYAFRPSFRLRARKWPTLGEMIADDQRVVVFIDHRATHHTPYIMEESNYFFEVPASGGGPDFESCDARLPPRELDHAVALPYNVDPIRAKESMYIVNHFTAHANDIEATNSAQGNSTSSILPHVDRCTVQWGHPPSVVLVDLFEYGDVFGAQRVMNGFEAGEDGEGFGFGYPTN